MKTLSGFREVCEGKTQQKKAELLKLIARIQANRLVQWVGLVIHWYIQCWLFIPRVIVRVNSKWNPLVIVGRNIAQKITDRWPSWYKRSSRESFMGTKYRWLDENEHAGEHVCLVSYPRSGNSLLRGLLEKITGIYTGCDTLPDRSLSKRLQEYGLKGEGVVDERVWFVKSHYPERYGYKEFKAKKAIVVIRNPWDAIDSYFNMMLTNSHTTSIAESQYMRFSDKWDKLLRNEIEVWMKFHLYWTQKQPIPIIVVRYEDLIVHREETLKRIFAFLTDSNSIEGTEWEERIRQVMEYGDDGVSPYKPRSGKIGASFHHYSKEQFDYILKKAQLWLTGFGYDTEKQNFPHEIPMPRRQVRGRTERGPRDSGDKNDISSSSNNVVADKKENDDDDDDALILNAKEANVHIRRPNDTFGRLFTRFRKKLVDPVIAADGTELNLHEVAIAREYFEKQTNTTKEPPL